MKPSAPLPDEQFLILAPPAILDASGSTIAIWWGPNRCGYVENIDDAGRYSKLDAETLVLFAARGDRALALSQIESMHVRRIVDRSDSKNSSVFFPEPVARHKRWKTKR